jgi:F420-non-reducing hydrogenase small subunit
MGFIMPDKPKLSMYWAASCGGCEIALVNIHEKILDVDAAFDFFFCPCLLDTKKKDVEALPDDGIAVTLFNGAIRTAENEEMAHLLRRKSGVLVAFGSCASEGCIPGLGNLHMPKGYLEDIYINSPTVDNPEGILPTPETGVKEGTLEIPEFYGRVRTLAQVTDVDYFMPGCPPESERIAEVVELLISGGPLPPKGSVIGAGTSNVCNECAREKTEKKIGKFYRPHEIEPDPKQCLLEQGLLCMGVATREGCGALCPAANMPCIGCYGPPEGVLDQGARMVSALGSVLDIGDLQGLGEKDIESRINGILDGIPDYAGTFYKFSLCGSLLGGRVK